MKLPVVGFKYSLTKHIKGWFHFENLVPHETTFSRFQCLHAGLPGEMILPPGNKMSDGSEWEC